MKRFSIVETNFKMNRNSELKWGSCSRLKLGCTTSMEAQWCWLQLKIGATSHELFEANHIWFWSLRSQKSNTSNGFQFGVEETREIWLIEAKLHKGHVITRWSSSQIIFGCLGSFFGPLFGLFLWQLGPLGFFLFSLTLSLVSRLFW